MMKNLVILGLLLFPSLAFAQTATTLNLNNAPVNLGNPLPIQPGTGTTFPVTESGLWTVNINGTVPISAAALPPLAAGTNSIGSISNTSFAATQSGTWNIGSITTLPNITLGAALPTGANTIGAVNINGTVPISASSLPLPGGAATATNQTTIQSAPGTPQTTAITVQGNSSGIALPVAIVSGGSGGSNAPYPYTTVNGTQPSLAVTTVTALTVPGTAVYAYVTAQGGSVQYSLENDFTPTATTGQQLGSGYTLILQGAAVEAAAKFIDSTGSTGTLLVQYFK